MNYIKNRIDNVSSWEIVYDRFLPAQEKLRESICTLGNGYFATRGAAPESLASRIHYPGTYIAGVYNKTVSHIAGRTVFNDDLVNCPNWLYSTFSIGKGRWIVPSKNKILSYYQKLDMRAGILIRKIRLQNRKGQITTIETQRIVDITNPHQAAIRCIIRPENYEGRLFVKIALDGTVENKGVARYRQLNSRHLKICSSGSFNKNSTYLSVKTSQSNINIALACKTHIFSGGQEIKPAGRVLIRKKKSIAQEFGLFVRKGQNYQIERHISIYTSRDEGIQNPLRAAINLTKKSPGFKRLIKTQGQGWAAFWKKFDIQIEGDTFSERILRLHSFHLFQTASIHNTKIDAGFPARGLHGEAYRGHIFWDELFALSFFNLHIPQISRALLLYRYRRLGQARRYAKENRFKGAMFPWQSASSGKEETQILHLNPISGKWGRDYSRFQRHISFSIAYNVWQYWEKSGDIEFLSSYGAELLLSIAQFGAVLSKYDSKDGRYHTEGLMGPDEFHEKLPGEAKPGLRDNAYTNLLIVWTLLKAGKALSILSKRDKDRLIKKLELGQRELHRWEDITRKMNVIINEKGIISQFEGYFKLKELDWEAYRGKYGNIQRLDRILKAEGKSPNDYQITKQADALMIFYLLPLSEVIFLFQRLGYNFSRNMLKKNYEYYIKRTSHGSTLSQVVHCYIAHLLGKWQESWHWFQEVLKSDIADTQRGSTAEGIHTGAMGGSINILMKCFAGIEILGDRIRIAPKLPKTWRNLKVTFQYKKRNIFLFITKHHLVIFIQGPKLKKIAFPVEIGNRQYCFRFGKKYKIGFAKKASSP